MKRSTRWAHAGARYMRVTICFGVLTIFGIGGSSGTFTAAASTLAGAIEQRFQSGLEPASSEHVNAALSVVQPAYAKSGFEPLWVSPTGVDSRGRELAQALRALSYDGLEPGDYGTARIEQLLQASSTAGLAELEIHLSLALVSAASDLASGRLQPQKVNPKLYIYPQDIDRTKVLEEARTSEEIAAYLQSFQPSQANYHRLKAALADYRALAQDIVWTNIGAGPTLEVGMNDPRVAQVRARLEALDDLRVSNETAAPPATAFDEALEQAIRRFQRRHGLDPDGRVGKNTLAELNVPLSQRVDQMLLNMERRRWMPDHFERRYVFVNLADFNLKVVENIGGHERTIHTTEVVVGKPYHQTPEFSHQIRYLVINPYWNVPVSIARDELLGKFKKDPSYIDTKGYELFDGWSASASRVDPNTVDWSALTRKNFRYKVRQGPGPTNALGRIKFMFPNPHNIYLHDTPSRTLFNRTERAFSHGCIRVKDPDTLASVLLQWQSDWPLERVQSVIEAGQRTVVSLAKPVPVHLTYITAWVNKDGTVNFRNDIYGRDDALGRGLFHPDLTILDAKSAESTANRPGPADSADPSEAANAPAPGSLTPG